MLGSRKMFLQSQREVSAVVEGHKHQRDFLFIGLRMPKPQGPSRKIDCRPRPRYRQREAFRDAGLSQQIDLHCFGCWMRVDGLGSHWSEIGLAAQRVVSAHSECILMRMGTLVNINSTAVHLSEKFAFIGVDPRPFFPVFPVVHFWLRLVWLKTWQFSGSSALSPVADSATLVDIRTDVV
jgi:hypothetical protein